MHAGTQQSLGYVGVIEVACIEQSACAKLAESINLHSALIYQHLNEVAKACIHSKGFYIY